MPVIRPGAKFAPFIIYTAGRSRTAWLSSFLSYGKCRCHNEIVVRLRSLEEFSLMFSVPGTGTAETGLAPAWRLVEYCVPGIKSVVVRRPIEEVIASFVRSEVADIASIDEPKLRKVIAYENRCLDQISKRKDTVTVDFKDLGQEGTCARVFEHCLPYSSDKKWWKSLKDVNIQADVRSIFVHYRDHRDAVEQFKKEAKRELINLVRSGKISREATI